jgi:hypothetical protein
MVKRIAAAIVGALTGVVLWHAAQWVRYQIHEADVIAVETCEPTEFIDCVGYMPRAPEPKVPAPCRDWLADGRRGGAVLSDCLSAARRYERGEGRAAAIAGST